MQKKWDAPNENADKIPTEFGDISHDSPRVRAIEDALSPRVPELDSTPPSKIYECQENNIKRLSSPKGLRKQRLRLSNPVQLRLALDPKQI